MDFDVTPTNMLPWQLDIRFSEKFSFHSKIPGKLFIAIICLNFTFSIIFLINYGHKATKVLVNKVQYHIAGHNSSQHSGIFDNLIRIIVRFYISHFLPKDSMHNMCFLTFSFSNFFFD